MVTKPTKTVAALLLALLLAGCGSTTTVSTPSPTPAHHKTPPSNAANVPSQTPKYTPASAPKHRLLCVFPGANGLEVVEPLAPGVGTVSGWGAACATNGGVPVSWSTFPTGYLYATATNRYYKVVQRRGAGYFVRQASVG